MQKIRFAKNDDIGHLKEIWKLCFGDSDRFIDDYFLHRFKAEQTVVLQREGKISAMLTIIPTQQVMPNGEKINSAMLYAIATHPSYQNRGFASQMIEFTHAYLKNNKNVSISTLVPANTGLFHFYRKLGYIEGFHTHETRIMKDKILSFDGGKPCSIKPTSPIEYHSLRSKLLTGRKYVDYNNEEIAYQKRISIFSGADIFEINVNGISGCAVGELISANKLLIKELLIPEGLTEKDFEQIIFTIAKSFPVGEYIIRTPEFFTLKESGETRKFGMLKPLKPSYHKETNEIEELGYLGLAFD